MNRPLLWLCRVVALTCGTLALLVLLLPLGLYALGLNNVEGRPLPSPAHTLTVEDRTLLEDTFRVTQPLSVEPLSPWGYYAVLILTDSRPSTAAIGANAASLVALHYNAHHLRNLRAIWWHLSGAALTIWITRHWTSDEVLSAAAVLVRQAPAHGSELKHARH
jgi:hypothetical protein